jgi:hypothetical protein
MQFFSIFIITLVVIAFAYLSFLQIALEHESYSAPQLSIVATVILAVFSFPFMEFWTILGGDLLKKVLGDGGTWMLLTFLDIALWAFAFTWVITRRLARRTSNE